MNRVEKLAGYIAESIHKNNPESSSVAVLKYALTSLLNTAITIMLVISLALLTGRLLPGLLAVVAFPTLRYISGGLHLKSPNLCNVFTALFMLIAIYVPIEYWYTGFVTNVLAVVVLLLNAPSGIKRSTVDPKTYPVLKFAAVGIVSLNFLFQSNVLAVVFLFQALTTTHIFQKLVDYIESKVVRL